MALIDKASLLMVPSTYEAGTLYNVLPSGNRAPDSTDQNSGYDQTRADFTFDRGSNAAATRVNADGLIEKYRENVLTYSKNLSSSGWTGSGCTSASAEDFEGGNDANQLTSSSSNGFWYHPFSLAGVQTLSIYAKAGTGDVLRLRLDSSTSPQAYFDLSSGTITNQTNNIDATMTAVSGADGWYKCTLTGNVSSPNNVRIYPTQNTNVVVYKVQLETGLVATDYLDSGATTAKAGVLIDLPRINYDANGENGALLLEPQRANIVPISEGIPEDENNVTLTENYGTSPEGVKNSLKVQKNGVDGNDRIQPIDNYNATLVSGNDYTISCFVKNIDATNGVTTLACRISGGSLFRSGYDWDGSSLSYLTTGYNAGARENIFVEDYGNGWWRIGFTFEADGTSGNFELDIDRRNGSNTTSIETYGWQLEAGSYVSSYIPNHGTSGGVTRAADSITSGTITAPLSGGYTAFIEFETQSTSVYNQIQFRETAANYVFRVGNQINVGAGSTIQTNTTGMNKFALQVSSGGAYELFKNGSSVATGTGITHDIELIKTDLAGQGVKQIAVFNEALTDAECITLTTL